MLHPLLKNPVNCDIAALLSVSKISAAEKRLWLGVLPYMTDDEKKELKKNLEEEVNYEIKVNEEAVNKFVAAFANGV